MTPFTAPHAATPSSVRLVPPLAPASPARPRCDVFCRAEPSSSLRRPEGATVSLAG